MTTEKEQRLLHAEDVISLAKEMRAAQREYFRTKNHDALERSKGLERALDTAIANYGNLL